MKIWERIEGYVILFLLIAEHILSKVLRRKSVIEDIEEIGEDEDMVC